MYWWVARRPSCPGYTTGRSGRLFAGQHIRIAFDRDAPPLRLCEHRHPRLREQRSRRGLVDLQPSPLPAEYPLASVAVDQQTRRAAVQASELRDILLG